MFLQLGVAFRYTYQGMAWLSGAGGNQQRDMEAEMETGRSRRTRGKED